MGSPPHAKSSVAGNVNISSRFANGPFESAFFPLKSLSICTANPNPASSGVQSGDSSEPNARRPASMRKASSA